MMNGVGVGVGEKEGSSFYMYFFLFRCRGRKGGGVHLLIQYINIKIKKIKKTPGFNRMQLR